MRRPRRCCPRARPSGRSCRRARCRSRPARSRGVTPVGGGGPYHDGPAGVRAVSGGVAGRDGGARDCDRLAELVVRGALGGGTAGLLPARGGLGEHVDPAGAGGADHDDVARDGDRRAEVVAGGGVGAFQLSCLLPARGGLGEHVRPAGLGSVERGADHDGAARGGDRRAEVVAGGGVGACQLGELAARRQTAPLAAWQPLPKQDRQMPVP